MPPPPAVRLAPVRCADLPDATVRAPLRVELGQRLLDDDAPDRRDFLLVSIACNGSDATVLAVRQNDGAAAVRRLVPFGRRRAGGPPARAGAGGRRADPRRRRRADADATISISGARRRHLARAAWTLTLNPSALYWGGYFSNNFFSMDGVALRIGVEHGPQRPASPSWQWALTSELTAFGGPYQTGYMAGLLALIQRRGHLFVPELGLGARAGGVTDFPTQRRRP